ncbi:hypothetical protein ANCDUO_17239 [Ancylostoma duodenale]|uniref:Ground-like domain-containing protein n=1 Tax=Ancylostoma duodenale TaxID=51022 RepID=A0A0C2C8I7_9BILA|nr:hypothetical protein ANCDUO_17239 [Ancylostoma duodenale]
MEEVEEVDHPPPVEATASPLEAKEIGDEISRNEATEDEENGFTYLVSTTEHCEAQKDNVICFVYKRPLLRH